jgi:hypothetical protein
MERFDNALEFMTPYSIIYGGAVRDCIAKKELVGDLDLAMPPNDFIGISEAFHTNPKWIPSANLNDKDIKLHIERDYGNVNVSSFETTGGKIVQLITSKYQDRDPLQSAIYVARMVDIVCCGVIMLCDGRVFEVVPGAHQDCVDGVLRINKNSDTINLDSLRLRVDKLVNRGWKNTIDIRRVTKEIEDKREKAKKKEQRLAELRSKKNNVDPVEGLKEFNFMFDRSDQKLVPGGYMQEIPKRQIESMFAGNSMSCVKLLELFASKEGINLRVKQTPLGNIFFDAANAQQAYKIQRRLQKHYDKCPGDFKKLRFVPKFEIAKDPFDIVQLDTSPTTSWGTTISGYSGSSTTYNSGSGATYTIRTSSSSI